MTQLGRSNWGSLSACLRIAVVCLLPVLLATCGEDASGPSGSPVVGRLEFTHGPLLSGGFSGPNLPIDRVHVIIARPPAGDIVKDTTRNFDPNINQLRLDLPILLRAAAESLDVTLELLSGTTVLFTGTRRLEAHAGPPSTTPPPSIPLTYSGPGSQIAQLLLAPLDSTLSQGDSLTMRVTGLDGNQLPIGAFYVGWSSSDTTIARVNGAGVVRGRVSRGTVYIRARTPDTQLFPTGIIESTTVTLVPDPSTIIKVAGDNQSGAVGTALAQMLEVEVRAGDNLPVPGVTVSFATSDVGASVDSATATTDANGIARTGAVLGTVQGTQTFTASVTGLSSVTFTATATAPPSPTWTGAVSSDWHNPANWSLGFVPGVGDSVTIPAGPANQPMLISNSANAAALRVDGTLNLNGLQVHAGGNVRGTGSLVNGGSAGALFMTGNAVTLSLPALSNVMIQGQVSLGSNVTINGFLEAQSNGNLSFATHAATVTGDFRTTTGGTITMTSTQDTLRVGNDALFDGGSTFGTLSSGVIVVGGDFTQQATGSARSYAPTGNHLDVLNGTGLQTVTFATPGATESNFETLAIANATGGVTIASNLFLSGPVGFAPGVPRIAHGGGQTLFVAELLASNATLDNILVAANNVLITQFDSINFINYSPAATPLTISHPGAATPFAFNDLTFGVTPTSGRYISVTDLVADANVLTINMVNPTPGTGAPFIQVAGGAVVNWPFVPAGARNWTGAVSSDWFTAGNWSPAIVPGAADDVVIPLTGTDPVLTSGVGVRNLTIQAGASLTSNSDVDVSGNAIVNGSFLGSGIIVMSTHGTSVAGNISNLEIFLPSRFESILVSGPLTVSGLIEVQRGHLDVGGNPVTTADFATISEGMLKMTQAAGTLIVNQNATFGGEDPTGVLVAGTIRVRGDFVQLTGITQGSFVATGTNRVILDGTGPQVVSFQHPGASHFQDLELANVADTLFMGSDWAATGQLITAAGGNVVVAGAGQLITTSGVAMGSGEFHNARVTIGGGAVAQFDNITWSNFSPFLVQLSVSRPSGTFTFSNHTFATTPSTGFYLRADDTNPSDGQPLTINMVAPTPGSPGSFVQIVGGAVVNWPAAGGTTAVWTGAVNSDWFNADNWSTGAVPTAVDDVDFTAFFTNAPSINANTAIRNLAVSSGRFITVNNGVTLTINGDAVLNGTISGPGTVLMAGTNKLVAGVYPNLEIGGTYTLGSTLQVNGTLRVLSDLTVGANSINLFGNLEVQAAGRLIMTSTSALVLVTGDVLFEGPSTVGTLTAGQLIVGGNFNQNSTNSLASFAASGTHQTNFNSAAGQAVTFASPGTSGFQTLIHSGSGTLSLFGDVQAVTFLSLVANQVNGGGSQLTTAGLIVANAVLDNLMLVVNSTQATSPLSIAGTTFQNYATTATQLSITHPGQATPFALDDLVFSTTPTAGGFYLSATDQNPSDGTPLVIDVTNTTPANGSPFVQVAGGAVVNWPGGPAPVVTWTGAADTDWNNPANWSTGQVPTATDSVVIVSTPNQPFLTSGAVIAAVHVAGGQLTVNGQTLSTLRGLTTTGSGILVMQNPSDVVVVLGDARFSGGDELTFMSAGVLQIHGDLIQENPNSNDSFHPSGSHITVLAGASPTVQFQSPGLVPGSSHFQDWYWTPSGSGTLTLGSDVFVHGQAFFATLGAQVVTGTDRLIQTGSFANGGPVELDGVRLVIDDAAGVLTGLASLTFSNQNPAQTQLQINHPGLGTPLVLSFFTFNTTPTTGRYLVVNDVAPVNGVPLDVEMIGPNPATDGGFSLATGGATITWPAGGGGGSIIWDGSASTDWFNAANWSTNQIPGSTDDVFIPVTANQPVLSTDAVMKDLQTAPGASVDADGQDLTVSGNFAGTVTSTTPGGILVLDGIGVTASGTAPSVDVTGDVTVSGGLQVTGNLLVTGSGAHLRMVSPGTTVSVSGDATFQGANSTGDMIDGVLAVDGDFVISTTFSTFPFVASGNHVTALANGAGQQSIVMPIAGPGGNHFANLNLAAPSTFALGTDVSVIGALTALSQSTVIVSSNNLLSVETSNVSGLTLDNTRLRFLGTTSAPPVLDNVVFQNQPATALQLEVDHPGSPSSIDFNNLVFNTVPSSGLYLLANDNNNFDGNTLTIDMVNPSPGTDGGRSLTNGGAVITWPAAGGGGASTWTGNADTDWNNTGNWQGGNVPGAGADVVIPAGRPNYPELVSSEIVGNMTVEPGASVVFVDGTLEVQGDLVGGGDMIGGGPFMSGTVVNLEMNSLGSLLAGGNVILAADLNVLGDLTIDGVPAHFSVNGHNATIQGGLQLVNSGTIQSTVAGGSLTVMGDALFDGGPLTGLMTQGTFTLHGNLTQQNSSTPNSFRTGPSFTTIMAGSAPQTITMADSLQSHFSNLSITGSGGVIANSLILVQSDLTLGNNVQVTATDPTASGGGFDVRGNVTTGTGSNLQLGRLYSTGNLTVNGTWATTSVIFQGATQTAPALPYNAVFVQIGNVTFAPSPVSMSSLTVASGSLSLGARTTVTSGVFVTGGTLIPNGHTLDISAGALNLSGSGTLTMQNPLDSVITAGTGAAIFGGGSTLGLLTDGVLKVGGSFSQTSGTSTTSFAASGNHKTVLGAAAVRVANFASPGTGGGGSHFANLDVTAASGGLTLSNNIVVDGALIAAPTGLTPQISGGAGGRTVTAMSLAINTSLTTSLIFDNAPLIVNEQGTIRSQQFDKAQFTGFPTTATSAILLDMTLVGAAGPRAVSFNTTSVQTSLGTGGLYARLTSSNGPTPVTVTMNGSNDPTGGPSRSNPSFGTTVNGARIVWQ